MVPGMGPSTLRVLDWLSMAETLNLFVFMLGVTYVCQGMHVKAENKLRKSVSLSHVSPGDQIWTIRLGGTFTC